MALDRESVAKETRHKIMNINSIEEVPTFKVNSARFFLTLPPPVYVF